MPIRIGSDNFFSSRVNEFAKIKTITLDKNINKAWVKFTSFVRKNIFCCFYKKETYKTDIQKRIQVLDRKLSGSTYNDKIDTYVGKLTSDIQEHALKEFLKDCLPLVKELSALSSELAEHKELLVAMNEIEGSHKVKACEALKKMPDLLNKVVTDNEELKGKINRLEAELKKDVYNNLDNLTDAMKNWSNVKEGVIRLLGQEYLRRNQEIPVILAWAKEMKAQRTKLIETKPNTSNFEFKKYGYYKDQIDEVKRIVKIQEVEVSEKNLKKSVANFLADQTLKLWSNQEQKIAVVKSAHVDANVTNIATIDTQISERESFDAAQFPEIGEDIAALKSDKAYLQVSIDLWDTLKLDDLQAEVKSKYKNIKTSLKALDRNTSKENILEMEAFYQEAKAKQQEIDTALSLFNLHRGLTVINESLNFSDLPPMEVQGVCELKLSVIDMLIKDLKALPEIEKNQFVFDNLNAESVLSALIELKKPYQEALNKQIIASVNEEWDALRLVYDKFKEFAVNKNPTADESVAVTNLYPDGVDKLQAMMKTLTKLSSLGVNLNIKLKRFTSDSTLNVSQSLDYLNNLKMKYDKVNETATGNLNEISNQFIQESIEQGEALLVEQLKDLEFLEPLLEIYDRVKTNDDGNCFFHSIVGGLESIDHPNVNKYKTMNAIQLRSALYDYMIENKDKYMEAFSHWLSLSIRDFVKKNDGALTKDQIAPDFFTTYENLEMLAESDFETQLAECCKNRETFKEYCNAMKDTMTYVDELELAAMRDMLGIKLAIHSQVYGEAGVSSGLMIGDDALPMIHIIRPGSVPHFDLLKTKEPSLPPTTAPPPLPPKPVEVKGEGERVT